MATVLPPATLGLLGGGQLGRYFVRAAHELGYRVMVLDPDADSPAGRIADTHLCAGYSDEVALAQLAGHCAAVTTEFENVPAASLDELARHITVRPGAAAVAVCQDRREEKRFLERHGLPVGPWAAIDSAAALAGTDAGLYPGLIKSARFGYDGKGQVAVASAAEAATAFAQLGGQPCVLEARLVLERELSVVLARDAEGAVRCHPVAENRHRNGILDISVAPAPIGEALAARAREMAATIAAGLGHVGTLAVEFFVSGGRLWVNEIAPRPHNSGHYTLDTCITSQYEQQVRALCGLPLGDPSASGPAVMVNLLGDLWQQGEPDWGALLAEPGLKLHLYGKRTARPGRKMGHFTVTGGPAAALWRAALAARTRLGIDFPHGAPT